MTLPLSPSILPPVAGIDQQAGGSGRAYTDIKGLEALKGDASSPQAMRRVAQEVEAMFLQMMLKSMRDASGGDGIFDSQEGRLYQDMFDKQIALDMSRHQHVGIADLLMRQLEHRSGAGGDGAAPAIPAGSSPAPFPVGPANPAATGATATVPASRGATDVEAADFAGRVLPAIRQAARRLGVDARALLAHAALETGWGQRVPRNADGTSSNNLFGIKAGEGWHGARATGSTLEFDGLVARRRLQAFRSYASVEESVTDFTRLLAGSPRYAQVLTQGNSPTAYARALAAAGYATDPDYASKINYILGGAKMRAAWPLRLAALQE